MEDIKKQLKLAIETYNKYATLYATHTKNKLLQYQLNRFITLLPKAPQILDAGCGIGRDSKYFKEEGINTTAIDISKGMIEEAKKQGIEVTKMNMKTLKFDKHSFDGIWCMTTFSDIPKQESTKVLKNFYKVLKPQGVVYISTRHGEGEKIIKKGIYNNAPKFYARYTPKELTELLKTHKFTILECSITPDNKWVEVYAQKS